MSDNIRLTKKQLVFITEMLEIKDNNKAAERFLEILIEERCNPEDISIIIDKILIRMVNMK